MGYIPTGNTQYKVNYYRQLHVNKLNNLRKNINS